ncbi:hypothetical protein [Tardiphaga sp.]|uniref:hypothetical protein n=1 Tax=Tardiphaga sp. TaxID=1926292 RepID=UPI0026272168|nr:hypothetical protein [Tardiphaga sp.]MDB5621230.1 putative rane protein of unknown function [Tardiphaga sp.]
MTISVAHSVEAARPWRGLLPLWVGIGVYALALVAGNQLLNDPDTYWQITVGQWILDHHAVPTTDLYSFTMRGQPWISTQWLSQVLLAGSYGAFGWAGPVVLTAAAIAASFALLTRFLSKRLSESTTLIFVAVALALMLGHLLARPHVLAMPVMVAWVGGLIAAMDRRCAPSYALLPLIALWANLHGGFVLGLALIAPIGIDAIFHAEVRAQKALLVRWFLFGLAACAASCLTPYGWESLLAARRILNLGAALAMIGEWRAADFGHAGPLELTVLIAFALVLWRGVTLPPMRIVLVLGFVFMALSHVRNAEVLALLAPLVLAKPLGERLGRPAGAEPVSPRGLLLGGIMACLLAGTFVFASTQAYAPYNRSSPAAAVTELKKLNLARVFNDYDFGGYLISRGVPTFIDGRTELFGEKLMVDHNNASGLAEPDNLFRLLKDYDIEATLMRTQSAATKLLDHLDGWQKVYSDDIATIHLRKAGAVHSVEPVVK